MPLVDAPRLLRSIPRYEERPDTAEIKYHEYFLLRRLFLGLCCSTSRHLSRVLSHQLCCGDGLWADAAVHEKRCPRAGTHGEQGEQGFSTSPIKIIRPLQNK